MFQSAITIFATFLLLANGAKFPSFIKKCSLSDPKLKECVLNQADSVRDAVLNGVPELKIPKLNPFHLKELKGHYEDKVEFKIENVDVYGLELLKIKDIKYDLTSVPIKVTSEVFVPEVGLYGDYDVDAKILALAIQGRGKFNVTISDFTLYINAEAERVKDKTNSEYFNLKSLKLDFDFGNFTYYVENLLNLFNGNKALADQTLAFINKNAKALSKDFRPAISAAVQAVILQVGAHLFKTFTVQEAFLP